LAYRKVTQSKVKSETPSTTTEQLRPQPSMYPGKETSSFLYLSRTGGAKVKKQIDYTKMELGRVTRSWKGKAVAHITRCAKCGKRGSRSLFIPEKTAARGGSRPNVSWHHKAHAAGAGGFLYMSIDESCTMVVDRTTVDDLLNIEERKEYDAHVAELRAWIETY
jgi:hypothetical protein